MSSFPSNHINSLSSGSSQAVSDLNTKLLLSPGLSTPALTPAMLNKYYEELARLQQSSTSTSTTSSSLFWSPMAASYAAATPAVYAFPPPVYGGGSTGATSTSSPSPSALLGGTPHPPAPPAECTTEYLADLVLEQKQLDALFPHAFNHVKRLVDEEIIRVRLALFQCDFATEDLHLPDPEGEVVTVTEKLYVPHREHPEYNFVGRILGPRGMTAKQLEQQSGCKIMVRGRGSMRDKRKEEANRGKPNWEHLDDELHVLIQCEDTPNRAAVRMQAAAERVKKLLISVPEGTDELKRKQLMELSIINGTYRPTKQTIPVVGSTQDAARLLSMAQSPQSSSALLSSMLGGQASILPTANLLNPSLAFPSISPSLGLGLSTVMNQSLLGSLISTYNLGSRATISKGREKRKRWDVEGDDTRQQKERRRH